MRQKIKLIVFVGIILLVALWLNGSLESRTQMANGKCILNGLPYSEGALVKESDETLAICQKGKWQEVNP